MLGDMQKDHSRPAFLASESSDDVLSLAESSGSRKNLSKYPSVIE